MPDHEDGLEGVARQLFAGGPRGDRWELNVRTGDVTAVEPAPAEPEDPPEQPKEQRNVVPHEGQGQDRTERDDPERDAVRSLFQRDAFGRAPYRWPGA